MQPFDKRHNYVKKLEALLGKRKLTAGMLQHVLIYHDDWCAVYRGGFCDCDPDVKLRSDTR